VNSDDFLKGDNPYRPAEKEQMLLDCIAAQIPVMDRNALALIRNQYITDMEDSPERTAVLELIEGHIALRDINGQMD
jgi:hypothetical protein